MPQFGCPNEETTVNEMGWFEKFATQGLYLPAFMVAFGSLVVLRAPHTAVLTEDQILAAPVWVRSLARLNSERLQRRGGWTTIGIAVFIAILRLSRG